MDTRDIKRLSDIKELISNDTTLNKRGRYYWGLCPFHHEKTASFKVDVEKQRADCYGCGWSGDVIAYVMRRYNLTFKEALDYLAARAGLPSPGWIYDRKALAKQIEKKEREKAVISKLKSLLEKEYLRLVNIEQWIYSILRSVTNELDFNRPAVLWALNTRDLLESLLDDWLRGNDKDRLLLMQHTKEVKLWPQM